MKIQFKLKILLFVIIGLLMIFTIPALAQSTTPGPITTTFQVTSEMMAGAAGAILSLLFSYLAGLNVKFAALPPEKKRLIMAVILALISGVIYGLGCANIFQTNISCNQNGIIQLASIFITAIITNQGVYGLSPQTQAVKDVKAAVVQAAQSKGWRGN
jgi:uncharacterized protein YacL